MSSPSKRCARIGDLAGTGHTAQLLNNLYNLVNAGRAHGIAARF